MPAVPRSPAPKIFALAMVAALAGVALPGCGGGSTTRRADPAEPATSGGSAAVAERGPLGEAECMQLLDHYLALAMAEKRAALPPDQVPTDEQVERIRASMRAQAREECVGRGERGRYECAMKATTTRALGVCLTETAPRS